MIASELGIGSEGAVWLLRVFNVMSPILRTSALGLLRGSPCLLSSEVWALVLGSRLGSLVVGGAVGVSPSPHLAPAAVARDSGLWWVSSDHAWLPAVQGWDPCPNSTEGSQDRL